MHRFDTVALIVAAGTGSRSGTAGPKQFTTVKGRPMIAHSYAALCRHSAVETVLVVCGPDQEQTVRTALGNVWHVTGGATRRASVLAGLEAIEVAGGAQRVLIHDAARPFLPSQIIDRLCDALDRSDAAVPVLRIADTLAYGDDTLGDSVSRDRLVRVQTPQAFAFASILAAHRDWPVARDATDDAQIARAAGMEVVTVPGDVRLEKITYPEDFQKVSARSPHPETRSAMGYDVHRLVKGEELWLGGVLIPHEFGLSGHSDADVALHAITDALLGTIAAGDIGTYFPPSDPRWRGAASAQFLEHAATLVEKAGGQIGFIDLTLICEMPKVGPYRDAMRDRIAALLRVDRARISIKATTTERLGFAGRGEGIAAQAIATIRLGEDGERNA